MPDALSLVKSKAFKTHGDKYNYLDINVNDHKLEFSEANMSKGKCGDEKEDWCDAGGQYLGFGTELKVGQIVECELCGKQVQLRSFLQRDFNVSPSYPRHKKRDTGVTDVETNRRG